MLWVYVHYNYVYTFSAGIDFRRQHLTSTDVRSKIDPRNVKVSSPILPSAYQHSNPFMLNILIPLHSQHKMFAGSSSMTLAQQKSKQSIGLAEKQTMY